MPRAPPVMATTRPSSGRGERAIRCPRVPRERVIVERIASFRHAGRRLGYTEYGTGARTVVLIHGLLLSQRMHEPLARALVARGNHVVTIDLLGHGRSDRPTEPARYSTSLFAEQVVALLDHLAVGEAVVLGTSLARTRAGGDHLSPERCAGWSSRCRSSTPRSSAASSRSARSWSASPSPSR